MFRLEGEKCECYNGTGKSPFHLFHYDRDELKIIWRTFPKFNPKKSCQDCFGAGEISSLTTRIVNSDLHKHIQNKIWDNFSKGK